MKRRIKFMRDIDRIAMDIIDIHESNDYKSAVNIINVIVHDYQRYTLSIWIRLKARNHRVATRTRAIFKAYALVHID